MTTIDIPKISLTFPGRISLLRAGGQSSLGHMSLVHRHPFGIKSLSFAFISISDQYATFIFVGIFFTNWPRRPFWMTENHFRSNFSQFQINTQLLFFEFWKSDLGHFG